MSIERSPVEELIGAMLEAYGIEVGDGGVDEALDRAFAMQQREAGVKLRSALFARLDELETQAAADPADESPTC